MTGRLTPDENEAHIWCGECTVRSKWSLDAAQELFTWAMKEFIGRDKWPHLLDRMNEECPDWAPDLIDFWASVIEKHHDNRGG